MSGPIVRKYGFPNFEKIFGPKPILHGEPAGEESSGSTGPDAEPILPRKESDPKDRPATKPTDRSV